MLSKEICKKCIEELEASERWGSVYYLEDGTEVDDDVIWEMGYVQCMYLVRDGDFLSLWTNREDINILP